MNPSNPNAEPQRPRTMRDAQQERQTQQPIGPGMSGVNYGEVQQAATEGAAGSANPNTGRSAVDTEIERAAQMLENSSVPSKREAAAKIRKAVQAYNGGSESFEQT